MEYLEAKAKGVPVYVFVLRQILSLLPVWKNNPQGDYAAAVDTPKLFEFVETLRDSQNHWVFEFERAQHITNTLRSQLAYLFMEGLILRERVKDLRLPQTLTNLSGKSLRILLERPRGWEYRFFSSVLTDEMQGDQELKWDLKYGLKIESIRSATELLHMLDWLQQKCKDIMALVYSAEMILNQAIQEALGPPGSPGDPEQLVYCARRVAHIRKRLVTWAIEFRCTEVQPECERLMQLMSEMSKDSVGQLEAFPAILDAEITKAEEAIARGEEYTATIKLTLKTPFSEELEAEFKELNTKLPSLLHP
jgi:hypothetical protein